jgi:hypothetical protein
MALLIGVALMSSGCASLSPSAANYPTPQQEMNQKQFTKNYADGNTGWDYFGWELLYWALYVGGQTVANK